MMVFFQCHLQSCFSCKVLAPKICARSYQILDSNCIARLCCEMESRIGVKHRRNVNVGTTGNKKPQRLFFPDCCCYVKWRLSLSTTATLPAMTLFIVFK